MKIFLSMYYLPDRPWVDSLVSELGRHGHQSYGKQLKAFFAPAGLHDPDALDEHLRDEDLAIALLSTNFLADRWLSGELHALLTLEAKLRPDFVLPVLQEGIRDADVPVECLNKDHVDLRNYPREQWLSVICEAVNKLAARRRLAVFISHSNKDKHIATAMSELLSKVFSLHPDEIISTGVEGHRLPLSVNTDETLRRKIREAKVFVCIATENSIGSESRSGSFYVAAELGARWGMKRYLALVLAGGATGATLKPPFSTLNALSCEDPSQVQQFIRQICPCARA